MRIYSSKTYLSHLKDNREKWDLFTKGEEYKSDKCDIHGRFLYKYSQSLSLNDILNSLYKLEAFVEDKGYSGWDPYDFLNSNKFKSIDNKYIKLMETQFLVYFPINLRSMLAIDKKREPKAIGIFLRAYCKMYRANLVSREKFETICNQLVDFLLENSSKGYSGYCWGFSFDWQDLRWLSKSGHPAMVITSIIGNAFLDLFEIIGDKRYLRISNNILIEMFK